MNREKVENMSRTLALCVLMALMLVARPAGSASQPLALEATIALPDTLGRIDHLDLDAKRGVLFVAEYGNNSLDIVDWRQRKVVHRIKGLDRPQGVGYSAPTDTLFIANGGDGTVRMFRGGDYKPLGVLKLGSNADNIVIDPRNGHVVVGYGHGGLAVIDARLRKVIADIHLPAHPEEFAIDPANGHTFVNVPDAQEIDVVDLDAGKQIAAWRNLRGADNYALAIDPKSALLATVFRNPPVMVLYDRNKGTVLGTSPACRDADGLFFDTQHQRIYASCGSGEVSVFTIQEGQPGGYLSAPPVATDPGARTAIFVPSLDRLFIARPAGTYSGNLPQDIAGYILNQSLPGPAGVSNNATAAILVYRPDT